MTMRNTLPFRFADGAAAGTAAADPEVPEPGRAQPGIRVSPDDPTLGSEAREWQRTQAELEINEERRRGRPNRAGIQNTVANNWRDEAEVIPSATPHLAAALSNLVSLEGEAYGPVQDWLADLKEAHKGEQARHYEIAERYEARGQKRQAAYHRQAAEDWQEASGVEEEIFGPVLREEGWQVVTPKSTRGSSQFKGGYFRHPTGSVNVRGQKVGGQFAQYLGLTTTELGELDRVVREEYGATAYLVEYKDIRGGIDTSHPFAVVDSTIYGAYDPQALAAKPVTTVYIPPPDWSPPNFQVDHAAIRERREREARIDAAGRATPAEVTAQVEDLYQRVDRGTDYTEDQAAEIQEAYEEARQAAAECYAATERAQTLSTLARKLATGAVSNVRASRAVAAEVLPDTATPAPDEAALSVLEADSDVGELEDIPDYVGDTHPTVAYTGADSTQEEQYYPSDSPEYSDIEAANIEVAQQITGPDDDLRMARIAARLNPEDRTLHPVLVSVKATYKARKADALAAEAVEASQEALSAAGRMTKAFARLRQLAREANMKADALPDAVDDDAQMYAGMADAEIAETMPLVQDTNRRVLMAQDMALFAAEKTDLAVKVAHNNHDWLENQFEAHGQEYNLNREAVDMARMSEAARLDVPEGYGDQAAERLERIVKHQRELTETPRYIANPGKGEELTPVFSPTTVVVPEGQETVNRKVKGRDVEGYEVDGVFHALADLTPVRDSGGQQVTEEPPDWVEPGSGRDVRRLVFEQKLANVPQLDPGVQLDRSTPADRDGDDKDDDDKPTGPLQMRDYQEAILDEMREKMEVDGLDSLLVTAPTGSGKTVVFSEYIRRLREEGKTAAVVTHREELLKQAEGAITQQTGETPGIVWQNQREWNKPITIISHGSLVQQNQQPPEDFKVDVVIFDEAHHSAAGGWQDIREKLKADKLVGFTATPFREDKKPLVPDIFAETIRPVAPDDLIRKGQLVPARVEKVELLGPDGEPRPIREANNQPALYADGVAYAHRQGRRKIILYVSQSEGKTPSQMVEETKAELDRQKINAGVVISVGPSAADREGAIEEFRKADRAVLVNYMTLVEGFNEPSTDCVIVGRDTDAENNLIQMVGRGLRPDPDNPAKTNCLVLNYTTRDDVGDILNYWRVDSPDRKARGRSSGGGQSRAKRSDAPPPTIEPRAAPPDTPEITTKPGYSPPNRRSLPMVAEKSPGSTPYTRSQGIDHTDGGEVVTAPRRRSGRRPEDEFDGGPTQVTIKM